LLFSIYPSVKGESNLVCQAADSVVVVGLRGVVRGWETTKTGRYPPLQHSLAVRKEAAELFRSITLPLRLTKGE